MNWETENTLLFLLYTILDGKISLIFEFKLRRSFIYTVTFIKSLIFKVLSISTE